MASVSNVAWQRLLDRRALRRLAGSPSFERGQDYFSNGQVRSIVEHEGTISAKVQGTQPYRIKLWMKSGELEYSCTCPVGGDGAFCKHCVAAGLAWLEQGAAEKAQGKKRSNPAATMDDVRAYLAAQDKTVLVDMLMELAIDDDRLRQRLLMKSAKRLPEVLVSPRSGRPSMKLWIWVGSSTTEAPLTTLVESRKRSIPSKSS